MSQAIRNIIEKTEARKIKSVSELYIRPSGTLEGEWEYKLFYGRWRGPVVEYYLEDVISARTRVSRGNIVVYFLKGKTPIFEVEDLQTRTWLVDLKGLKDMKDRGLV